MTEQRAESQEIEGSARDGTTPFKRWYQDHKDQHNQKRKNRYKLDPAYREQVKRQQRLYRASKPSEPKGYIPKYREIGGQYIEVFRVGLVCSELKISNRTIVLWEDTGLIPKTTVEGKHRYYTEYQIGLLRVFAEGMAANRFNWKTRDEVVKALSKTLFENWR